MVLVAVLLVVSSAVLSVGGIQGDFSEIWGCHVTNCGKIFSDELVWRNGSATDL
ncbi:MAG: hypothetical protein LBG97_10430 [Coriobacteriales bacterium]|nr:hypothetical protein [Coriobacteriales bacterium]